MILTKLLLLASFITIIIFIIDPNEFLSFWLGKNITRSKLRKLVLYSMIVCLWGIYAIFYFYYHPDTWKPVGKWELWTAVVLGCTYLITLIFNICRYIKKHPNS